MFGLDQIEPLQGDLLTGTAGIAVFLAELYQSTGKPAYWAFAQDALTATSEFVAVSGRSGAYRRLCGGRPAVGGFVGIGSAIYALARCGQVIGDPQLLDRATALVPVAAARLSTGDTLADPVLGRAGLLLALLKLVDARPAADPGDLCGLLYDQLSAELTAGIDRAYPPGVALLDGLPTGAAGVTMALARYAARYRPADLDRIGALELPVGTPGDRLAAIAVATVTGAAVPPEAGVQAARGTDLLDRIEAGLAAYRATGEDAYRTGAHTALRALLKRRAGQGRWLPDRRRTDRLQMSAVNGVAAIGLACLALADDDVTSLRTMA
jgi:hypothetical protein